MSFLKPLGTHVMKHDFQSTSFFGFRVFTRNKFGHVCILGLSRMLYHSAVCVFGDLNLSIANIKTATGFL